MPKRDDDLTIHKIPTKSKDLVKKSPHPEILPKHAFRVMFSGASRSGKTNLLISLITDKRFFKGYFDIIFLFSGSALTDDIWNNTTSIIKKHHRFSTLDIKALDEIWTIQNKLVKESGISQSPKMLIIFDDCIDSKNINKPEFQRIYFRGRHVNISCFVATQKYNKIPFAVREQITNLFLFRPRMKEMKTIVEEITPSGMTEKQMEHIIMTATAEPYAFLHADFTAPREKIFRKNLDTILRYQ